MAENEAAPVAPETPAAPAAAPETAGTAPAAEAPVSGESTPASITEEAKPEKTYSQAEVDALISKRLARQARKQEREQQQYVRPDPAPPAPAQPQVDARPKVEDFKTTEDYVEAVADWKAEKVVAEKLEQHDKRQREERVRTAEAAATQTFRKAEETARVKYEDYDDVVYDTGLPITDDMAHVIRTSDVGTKLFYYLGTHHDVAERISKLPRFLQVKELGRLEVKLPELLTAKPAAKPNALPDPIKPVTPRGGTAQFTDTTDPRSLKALGTTGWIEAERQRQEEKWKAAHPR